MRRIPAIVALALVVVGCWELVSRNAGVYLLLDTSGTYTAQLDNAEQIINCTLTRLNGKDSFAVARIDTGRFSERDIRIPLDDFEVIALNVTKLTSDNVDPRELLDRLESWKARVERGGGIWRVVNDLDQLERLL